MSEVEIDLQIACTYDDIPRAELFKHWVSLATEQLNQPIEITVRVVDAEESRTLNRDYRHKDSPTNVLSFPFDVPEGIELNLLGDLVICAEVVAREAEEQHKKPLDHWAHMVIHGALHLQGFDHMEDDEAELMEERERQLLARLGIADPYRSAEETPIDS